jgi:hypothetical protein
MTDLLVLAPWLIFGAGLGVIGFRLLSHRGAGRRHRRDTRLRRLRRPDPAMRDHGNRAAHPGRRPAGRREGR